MVFSSTVFLFFYLPVVLCIYYVTPLRWRNAFLLAANLAFYGWGEPVYILVMLVSTAMNYALGLLVEKHRRQDRRARAVVALACVLNLGILFFFKYYDFVIANLRAIPGLQGLAPLGLALPIGISFYTFQAMSYVIDVYRSDARVQRNAVTFGVYITLFPQLVAGPIVRYRDVDEQLVRRETSAEKFAAGVCRFAVGLAKKVLLANGIGALWDVYAAADLASLSVLGAWLGALAFTFQIYFDFSGYSDMAVGLGRMLGFEFKSNFAHPYMSGSVTEFWRRWHITLGDWFRTYLYIPLGGNRVSKARWMRNILIVWAATGIWHGASWSFVIWGLYFGLILMLEKLVLLKWLARAPAALGHVYTMLLVIVSWVVFAVPDIRDAAGYLGAMFGLGARAAFAPADLYALVSYLPMLLVMAVASTDLGAKAIRRLPEKARGVLSPLLVLLALVICAAYLVDATYNPFLYFRF